MHKTVPKFKIFSKISSKNRLEFFLLPEFHFALGYAILRPAQARKWKLSLDDVHQFLVVAEMEDQQNEINPENIADFLGDDAPMPEGFMETNRRKTEVKPQFADLISADAPADLMMPAPAKTSVTADTTAVTPEGSATNHPDRRASKRGSTGVAGLRRSVRRASAKANGEPSVRRASIAYLEAQMMVKQAAPKKRRGSILDMMMDPLGLEASNDIAVEEAMQEAARRGSHGVFEKKQLINS